jgi:hypothetical protein
MIRLRPSAGSGCTASHPSLCSLATARLTVGSGIPVISWSPRYTAGPSAAVAANHLIDDAQLVEGRGTAIPV